VLFLRYTWCTNVAIGRKLETHKLKPRLSNTFFESCSSFTWSSEKCLDGSWAISKMEEFIPNTLKFLKEKNLPPAALLTLDNVPSYPHATLISKSVCALFLLPNVTANGPRCVRMFKKCRLLRTLLDETGNGDSVFSYSNQINLKGATAYCLAEP